MRKLFACICFCVIMGVSIVVALKTNYVKDFLADFGFFGGTVTVSGKITNLELEPIDGVVINFSRDGGGVTRKVATDKNGNYQLRVPKDVSGIMSFSLEGLRTIREKSISYNDNVMNRKMHSDSISGKITDNNGRPIEGVEIVFEKNGGKAGSLTTYSDENGNYVLRIPEDDVQYWITLNAKGRDTYRNKMFCTGGVSYNFRMK